MNDIGGTCITNYNRVHAKQMITGFPFKTNDNGERAKQMIMRYVQNK